jgi:hypothetical protein
MNAPSHWFRFGKTARKLLVALALLPASSPILHAAVPPPIERIEEIRARLAAQMAADPAAADSVAGRPFAQWMNWPNWNNWRNWNNWNNWGNWLNR